MKNYDEPRRFLKTHGWRREDRTGINGDHTERWLPPWNGVGYCPQAMSFEAAYKNAKNNETQKTKS